MIALPFERTTRTWPVSTGIEVCLVDELALLAAAGSLTAEPEPGSSAIINVCGAASLDEATIRGGRLGWSTAPEDRNWRTSYERHNGDTVRVVGWRRSEREGDGLLSYWTASGHNAHTACATSADSPGLLDALRDRFAASNTFNLQGEVVSAFWRRGSRDLSFTRVGVSSLFSLTRRR